jgi:MFS superfamily sulfate permease-like transporter
MSIVGAMLIFVSFQLVKFIKDIRIKKEIFVMLITAVLSLITNMAIGFTTGIIIFYLFKKTGILQ